MAQKNNNLQLTFSLIKKASGKDSNLTYTEIEISNNQINISKKHGFRPQKYENLEKPINDEQSQKILDFIEINKLNINIEEHKKTEGIGTAGFLQFNMILPTKSEISIDGKIRMSGTDKYVRKKWGRRYIKSRTNIKNIEYFDIALNFINLIDNL